MFSKVAKAILDSCKSDLSWSSINMERNLEELEAFLLATLTVDDLLSTNEHILRHSRYFCFVWLKHSYENI